MKVCIINKWDVEGGAARAAYRLFTGLRRDNVETEYYVHVKKSSEKGIFKADYKEELYRTRIEDLVQHIYIHLNRTDLSNTFFSFTYAGVDLFLDKILSSDVINVHWIDKMVPPDLLARLASLGKPVVWTLHDMKPFTGGCHYSAGCDRYMRDCTNCPQLKYDPFGLPNRVVKQKLELFNKIPLVIVCPSQWLANEARKSSVFANNRIEVIPNSVETELFRPVSKNESKKELGVKEDQCVLQFGAHDGKERRKGFHLLISALKKALDNPGFRDLCEKKKVVVLCLGDPSKELKKLPIETLELGYLDKDPDIVRSYNATDVYVLPTLEDNLPNTMLESLACATPVVAFGSGGVTEVVHHEENGLIAECGDTTMLASHIIELVLDKEKRERFGENGRKLIETKFRLDIQSQAYKKLFEELLNSGDSGCVEEGSHSHDHLFDDIVGYSFRNELLLNSVARSQEKTDAGPRSWENALDSMCRNSFWKHPLIKINAYIELVSLYNKEP